MTGTASASQDFEAANNAFDVAAIDDFTIGGAENIVSVQAVFLGFNGFNSYNNITNYRVEFYTSTASGAANLTGNAGSQIVAPGGVTVNTSFDASSTLVALVTIPVNITLASAGTYWVGVVPVLDFANGQSGLMQSNFGAGFPNGINAVHVNPGGGFAFPGNQTPILTGGTGVNLAYRVTAAPVPEPMTLSVFALALGALAARRRKKS